MSDHAKRLDQFVNNWQRGFARGLIEFRMESTSTFRSDTFHESIGYLGILLKGRKRQREREREKEGEEEEEEEEKRETRWQR